MIKPDPSPLAVKPGKLCGFFDREQFQLGVITDFTDKNCRITRLPNEAIQLPLNRLVLISDDLYSIENPGLVLNSFQQQIESFQTELPLTEIRQKLLQTSNESSLADIIRICNLPESDACRFALFLALRSHPARFRFKKGLYRALGETEEQEYYRSEELKELHQKDLDACPLLAKRGFPVLFSPAVLKEAELIKEYQSVPDRMDLTYMECWTIDAEDSFDLDDAISLEEKESGWELGIHISDVSTYISPESSLDREALRRVTSAYLPGLSVHMLPESLSCNKASLLEGQIRPALSIVCTISPDWEIVSYLIFPSQIIVTRNFSYDEVDALLSNDVPPFNPELQSRVKVLQTITEKHVQKRVEQGAVIWEDNDKSLSRKIVAECMVIYNRILVDLVAENEVPLYYRFSETREESAQDSSGRVIIPPSVIGTEPRPHTTMGLKVYAQATSPLRRYSDLVNQRQIISFLNSDDLPYTKAQLDSRLEHLIHTQRSIRQLTIQAENL